MKSILHDYAVYHLHANATMADMLHRFEMNFDARKVPQPTDAMKRIVLEMWDEGVLWWQRLKLQEAIIRPTKDFSGTLQEAFSAVQVQDTLWESWIEHAQPMALDHVFQYYDSKRHCHKLPAYKMLLHVFNHAAQCRGSLMQILHETGWEDISSIDMIPKSRSKRHAYK